MDNIQLIRNTVIANYTSNFPKATKSEIEKYVDELFAFQIFLSEKHNITHQEGIELCLNIIQKDSDKILKRNEQILSVISMIEEKMKNGIYPTKEDIQAIQPILISDSMKRIALDNGYPEDKATELYLSAKILD